VGITWREELLELVVRHSDVGLQPDLLDMDNNELCGALMFLRGLEANER
jgi:hypothetical protein